MHTHTHTHTHRRTYIFLNRLSINNEISNLMDNSPLVTEMFLEGGRTVITKLRVAFRGLGPCLKSGWNGVDWKSLLAIGTSEWLFEAQLIFGSCHIFGIFDQFNVCQTGHSVNLYYKVFQSVHSCTSNTSSIFLPNTHDILNIYFIKPLLHVSLFYTPSSGRTSYYLLKTVCFLQCCAVLHWLCHGA